MDGAFVEGVLEGKDTPGVTKPVQKNPKQAQPTIDSSTKPQWELWMCETHPNRAHTCLCPL